MCLHIQNIDMLILQMQKNAVLLFSMVFINTRLISKHLYMVVLSDVRSALYTHTFQKNEFVLSWKTIYLKSVNFLFLLSIE